MKPTKIDRLASGEVEAVLRGMLHKQGTSSVCVQVGDEDLMIIQHINSGNTEQVSALTAGICKAVYRLLKAMCGDRVPKKSEVTEFCGIILNVMMQFRNDEKRKKGDDDDDHQQQDGK